MRLRFGDYLPDQPDLSNQKGLSKAVNMFPHSGGWKQVPGLAAIGGATAIDAYPRGSISGLTSGGSGFTFAGDGTKLYRLRDGGMADVSKSGGYSLGANDRWDFDLFDQTVFAVAPNINSQFYSLSTLDNFADVDLGMPRASHIGVVGAFVMVGNLYDRNSGRLPEAIHWSAIRQPLYWPTVGSDEAISVQSDRQVLEGGGGWVQDVIGGAEVGAVFQERAIWRMDHQGGDLFFAIRRVERGAGMLIPGSAVAFERSIFFIAEDGFRIFDYTQSVNIGKDRINSTFLADVDQDYLDRVTVARDPDSTRIWISYPGSGNTSGRPNKYIVYDYALDKWGHGELEHEGLVERAADNARSLDAPATATDPSNIDDATYGKDSFDERGSVSGGTRLGAFNTSFVVSDFSGDPLAARAETGELEFFEGQLAHISEVRPQVDGRDISLLLQTRMRRGENAEWGDEIRMDDEGKCNPRVVSRYHKIAALMPAGWDDAIGLDVIATPAGRR
jgi:hypothetical protein